VIGDPLTVVAGAMRERFLPFLLMVAIAKRDATSRSRCSPWGDRLR
jgi:hypothetical protein